ncbi:uncharacterized protein LOC134534445 [Bacillus rossius redtenbacheri]|uniref:uncharacterized protein LOC134534445 n=1 Tax=Bacillus rossius redtenbacheri TaxID=93214 RepID=UPI002FDE8882
MIASAATHLLVFLLFAALPARRDVEAASGPRRQWIGAGVRQSESSGGPGGHPTRLVPSGEAGSLAAGGAELADGAGGPRGAPDATSDPGSWRSLARRRRCLRGPADLAGLARDMFISFVDRQHARKERRRRRKERLGRRREQRRGVASGAVEAEA